jgi:hypothetical protein
MQVRMALVPILLAASAATAGAQRDTLAKSATPDTVSATQPVTVAGAEAAGMKLLGVFDATTGEWIHGATVRDTLGDQTVTSDVGVASLEVLSPLLRVYMLEIRKEGYAPAHFKLRADTASEFLVSLTRNPLGQAKSLPGMVTTARQSLNEDPGLREGFFKRCQLAPDVCIGRRILDAHPTGHLADVVGNLPGIRRACPPERSLTACWFQMLKFPIEPYPNEHCIPTFYLNGNEWAALGGQTQAQLDQFFVPEHIEGIEVYLSGQPRPLRWTIPGSSCGVVVIWTR